MKSKYIIIVAALILITVIILLLDLSSESKEEVIQLYLSEQLTNTHQLGIGIVSYLKGETKNIHLFTDLPEFQNHALDKMKGDIQKYLKANVNNHIKEVCVYDSKGTIIFSTTKESIGHNYDQSDFFNWASSNTNKDRSFVSSILEKREDFTEPISSFSVLLAVPIYKQVNNSLSKTPENVFIGMVTATLDLRGLIYELLPLVIADTSSFSANILDIKGAMIFNTKHSPMDNRNITSPDKTCFNCHVSLNHLYTMLSSGEGSVEFVIKGMSNITVCFSSIKFNNISWIIGLNVPIEKIKKPLNKNLELTLVLIGIILFSFSVGIISIYRGKRLQIKAEEDGKQWKEKHDLQTKILEAEAQYKTVIDNLPDAIIILCEGNIVFVNDSAVKMFGASNPEYFIGKSALDFVYPDDRDFVRGRLIKESIAGFVLPRAEERFIKIDGSIISVEVISMSTLFQGKPSLLSIVHDITIRKQSDLEREVLYEITNGVTKSSNLGELLSLIHQALGKMVYANNCFIALYDQNTGLFSFPYFVDKFDTTPEPMAMPKSCSAYVFRTGKPLLLTPELSQKFEEQNEIELIGSPSPSWIGVPLKTPTRTIGVLVLQHYEKENAYSERDVSFLTAVGAQIAFVIERKLAEEEISILAHALRNINECVSITDLENKFIFVNQSFLKTYGYTENELIGKHLEIVRSKSNPSDIGNKIFSDTSVGGWNGEVLNVRKDGSEFPVYLSTKIIYDKDGKTLGRVGVASDITERKRSEQEIRKLNEQLLKTISEKDQFFSIIAHDLKSPFLGFLGLTEMMSMENEDFTKAELIEYSKTMHESALTLFRLIENLLEWSQMQKGTINFVPRELNLSNVIIKNIEIINQRALQKGISIINELITPEKVYADEKMVDTILRNLLSNAVKFTKRDGKVVVKAKKTEGEMVEVSVSDTGVGIPAKDIKKLFRIEEKVSSKGTEGELSTGLGLLLCKEFIEKNKGRIWVESKEGVSSTFFFTLPQHE